MYMCIYIYTYIMYTYLVRLGSYQEVVCSASRVLLPAKTSSNDV